MIQIPTSQAYFPAMPYNPYAGTNMTTMAYNPYAEKMFEHPFAGLSQEQIEEVVARQEKRLQEIEKKYMKDGEVIDYNGLTKALTNSTNERDNEIKKMREENKANKKEIETNKPKEEQQVPKFGDLTNNEKTETVESPLNQKHDLKANVQVELKEFRKELKKLEETDIDTLDKPEQAEILAKKEIYKKGIEGLEKLLSNHSYNSDEDLTKIADELKKAINDIKLMYDTKYPNGIENDEVAQEVYNLVNQSNEAPAAKTTEEAPVKEAPVDEAPVKEAPVAKKTEEAPAAEIPSILAQVNQKQKEAQEKKAKELDEATKFLQEKAQYLKIGADLSGISPEDNKEMQKSIEIILKNLDDTRIFTYNPNNSKETQTISATLLNSILSELKKIEAQPNNSITDQKINTGEILNKFKSTPNTDPQRHLFIYNLPDDEFLAFIKDKKTNIAEMLQDATLDCWDDTATHGLIIQRLCQIRKDTLKDKAFSDYSNNEKEEYDKISSFENNGATKWQDIQSEYEDNDKLGKKFSKEEDWEDYYTRLLKDL